MEGFYLDIESDALYLQSTKIWYVKLRDLDGKKELAVHPFRDKDAAQKIKDFIHSYNDGCLVAGHNLLGFDMWAMWQSGLSWHRSIFRPRTIQNTAGL